MARLPLKHRINNCLFTYKEIERYFGVPVKLAQKRYENGKRGKELIVGRVNIDDFVVSINDHSDLLEREIAELANTTQQNVSRILIKFGRRRQYVED